MSKTRTLIVSGTKVKKLFKAECSYNGLDMGIVTETLWKSYVIASMERRKKRGDEYKKIKKEQDGKI